MPLLLNVKRSVLQKWTRTAGRLALLLALFFMTLEMMRVRGWGSMWVEQAAASFGLSAAEFWSYAANISVAAAFALLILGLVATGLSRSRMLDDVEQEEEKINVEEISEWIRSYEVHQQAGRGA